MVNREKGETVTDFLFLGFKITLMTTTALKLKAMTFDTFSHHRACLLRRPGLEKIYAIRYPPHTPRNLRVLLMAMETRSCSCTLL